MITVLCDVGALEKNKTSKQTDKIIKNFQILSKKQNKYILSEKLTFLLSNLIVNLFVIIKLN